MYVRLLIHNFDINVLVEGSYVSQMSQGDTLKFQIFSLELI